MSENQKNIAKKLKEAIKTLPSEDKTYLCGFVDGMSASVACAKKMEESKEGGESVGD